MLQKLEQSDKTLDAALKMLRISFCVSVALGVILLLRYCGTIGYYPSGVTIGDGFLLIATSLSFSVGYLIIVAVFLCTAVTLSPIAKIVQRCIIWIYVKAKKLKEQPKQIFFPKIEWYQFPVILVGFVILVVTVAIFDERPIKSLHILLSSIFMTFLYGLWNTPLRTNDKEDKNFPKKVKAWLSIAMFLTPLLVGKVPDKGLDWAMTAIGIRIEGATIQLTDRYAKILELNGIEAEKKNGKRLTGYYTNVDILFNGVGMNNVIEINGFKLIVPAKEAIIGIGSTPVPKKS